MTQDKITRDDVLALFSRFDLNDAESAYLEGQAQRIAYLRNLVQTYCTNIVGPADILDVGPHFLTRCIVDTIHPTPRISTIGFDYQNLLPMERVYRRAVLDVNDCGSLPLPFEGNSIDIILLCEIIEHLFIPPDVVYNFLKPLLKKSGFLIVGTPNAVSISKRLKMVMGENPYQELSPEYKSGMVHIREYTMKELRKYGEWAELNVHYEEYCDYWDQYHFIESQQITALEREDQLFRGGLTIVYQS